MTKALEAGLKAVEGVAHTPGPWTIRQLEPDGYFHHHIMNNYGEVCSIQQPRHFDYAPEDQSYDIAQANARLMTAAPDLLKALERCVYVISCAQEEKGYAQRSPLIRDSLAAIAKARGAK